MCSVSFLPCDGIFHLLMNRDEQRSRAAAVPPAWHRRGKRLAMFPYEAGGGTWMGVNDAGLAIALINWYSQPQIAASASRGEIIPALLDASSAAEAEEMLRAQPLKRMNPFRLIILSGKERSVREWRSDGRRLEGRSLAWNRQHWFSSGFDEAGANIERSGDCRAAETEPDSESLEWLRRLHRSHHAERGAYSMCMHRKDACTVSCTELSVSETRAEMIYHAGAPCCSAPKFWMTLNVTKSCQAA